MVYLVSFVARKPTRATSNKSPQSVSYADIAKTKHLLHQISLAGMTKNKLYKFIL